MGNFFASLFPFAVAGVLVLAALMGSRLSMARRRAAEWAILIVATAAAAGMLLWLARRGDSINPFIFILPVFLINILSRLFPRARRALTALGGAAMIGYGFIFSYLSAFDIRNEVAFLVFRWTLVGCGVMLIVAAWRNWLAVTEDDAPLRPAANRLPRHFGETS